MKKFNIMSYNFHIGQDIVALKDHSQGAYKKDDVFTVKGLMESFCNCGGVLVDIGLTKKKYFMRCKKCMYRVENNTNSKWFMANNFAPLDSLTNIEELTQVLEQPLYQL